MTIRAVKALRLARLRQREVAAAEHAARAGEHDQAQRAVAATRGKLEAALDGARDNLAAATSVFDLDAVAEAIADDHRALSDADRMSAVAAEAASKAAEALYQRTRLLRTAEKLCDRVQREYAAGVARAEQRAADDRASRRKP